MRPESLMDLLTRTLRSGVATLPERFRLDQAAWLMDGQRSDGGFAGRRGESDLYYTAFALRAVELLGLPDATFHRMTLRYLRRHAPSPHSVVDVVSSLFVAGVLARRSLDPWCDGCRDERRVQTLTTLDLFRRDDGGFAREIDGPSSLYHTFLALLCGFMLDEPVLDPERAVALVKSRRSLGGGFADLPDHPVEATNPTAAAAAILRELDALDEDFSESTAAFLRSMQRIDGGFAAHADAPAADLLSTFSAVVALARLDALTGVKLGGVGRFVKSLACPDGGFLGVFADDEADVEYTYYGLATLGLLAVHLHARGPGVASR